MKKFLFLFFMCVLVSGGLFAGSLKLMNDSPYKLRVEIWGNDDSKIGELVIEKNTFQTHHPQNML